MTNQILLNGAGVAAADVDGDGWTDLYFCASHGTNALFRNRGGWRFERVPNAGGAGCANLTSTGACFADLDGDGDMDLVVNTLGQGTHVFRNDGAATFAPFSEPLNGRAGGMTSALADVDGDGFLDLYIANYRTSGLMDMPNARATFRTVEGRMEVQSVNGRPVTDPEFANRFHVGPRGEVEELGEPDAFYRNLGGTNFALQPHTMFLDEDGRPLKEPLREWGLSAMFRDLNGDTRPDLFVCNDFQTPDRLWLNQGAGVLRLAPRGTFRHTSRFSMAADVADINRDGRDDVLVLDMMSRQHTQRMRSTPDPLPLEELIRDPLGFPQYGRNMLFLNRGGMRFSDVAHLAGLEASDWSWACVFVDVDLDGFEDILITTGMERAARDQDVLERLQAMRAARRMSEAEIFEARRMYPRLATPKVAFRNRGDLTFEDAGELWGFHGAGVSQAMALADLDNDGDLDVVVSQLNAPVGIYRNDAIAPRLTVRLAGTAPNTRGIGARLRVIAPDGTTQSQEVIAGGRYLSGDDPVRCFAGFSLTNRFKLEVLWRSGRRSQIASAEPNHLYVIQEPATEPMPSPLPPAPARALFEDVGARLNWRHVDAPFNDFESQPLLPWKLSEIGPCVGWVDFDGDGDDDLVVGPGKGGIPGLFVNDGHGLFEVAPGERTPSGREATGIAIFPQENGSADVLVGFSHYEEPQAGGALVRRLGLQAVADISLVSSNMGAAGPIALADIDGDADLDLFVAGRVLPDRYPEPATSRWFRNTGGAFDPVAAGEFPRVGLVNGCVWTDADADGDPDLILACEWGPIRLFLNQSGRFQDATAAWKLAEHPGLWMGVTTGDFDGDGRMDLAAGNWGRNTKYQAHLGQPVRLHFKDVDEDGRVEILEGWFDVAMKREVPARQRDVLARVLPNLRERFATHRAFGTASLADILADRWSGAGVVEVRSLESAVFLNRGDHFERRPLPIEAQMTSAMGVCVSDANGDGREDIFLSQNTFGLQPEDSRLDAGCGLWLLGDGTGGFRALSASESGVEILGEQRGAAVGDFDADGRIDLAVGERGGPIHLFQNRDGVPGLRVRLLGPAGNRYAIGAVVRIRTGAGWGPAREVHAGSGWGSQDSTVVVLGLAATPIEAEVRWPGGKTSRVPVPPGQTEIRIAFPVHREGRGEEGGA